VTTISRAASVLTALIIMAWLTVPGAAAAPVTGSPPGAASAPPPRFDPSLEWPLGDFDAAALWQRTQGAGVTIAVVDTGIDARQPDLAGAVTGSAPPADLSADSHGTAVAGLIAARGSGPGHMAGLAPQARLIDIRVTAQAADVTPDAIAAGISAADRAGAQIINVSLGTQRGDPRLQQAVFLAEEHDRLVVASAGAGPQAEYPADYPGVLAVGAAARGGGPLVGLAGSGPLALYAPGQDLYSTAETARGDYVRDISGSDYATAYVSAAAALLLSAGLQDPEAAGRRLVQAATSIPGIAGPGYLSPASAMPASSSAAGSASAVGGRSTASSGSGPVRLVLMLLAGLVVLAGVAGGGLLTVRIRGNRKGWPPRRPATYVPGSWDQPW
jgi:subtilisin family serine protease